MRRDMASQRIIAGSRTVGHVAEHFELLKQSCQQLRTQFGVRQRGFFTPTEDEQTRHLLVSYWQARAALFELILSFKDEAQGESDASREAFVVAYAAVILLVDAARFLREQFGRNTVIVAELNEAEPHFGIPPQVYDTVQHSLTSPVHAWHLYHAQRYLLRHRRALGQLASGDDALQPAMAVIKKLGRRARIALPRYISARARVRGRQLKDLMVQTAVGKLVYAVETLAGRTVADIYTRPGHHPALPPHVCDQLRALLEPGDVLISRKEHALTNYFLPGYWPHASFYLGDAETLRQMGIADHEHVAPRWDRILPTGGEDPRRVLEAQKDGVHIRSLNSPLTCDAIAVVRPRIDRPLIADALARAIFHEGKPYDFDFDFTRADRLVCTEVAYRAYEGLGGINFELTRRAGRLTFSAEDLLRMALARQHFKPLAVYSASHYKLLATDDSAAQVLAATMADQP